MAETGCSEESAGCSEESAGSTDKSAGSPDKLAVSPDDSSGSFPDEVSAELEALAAIYSAAGEFSMEDCQGLKEDPRSPYVCHVTIKPRDMPLGLCLSLPVSYPETCPRIEIVALPDSFPQDSVGKLLVRLYQVAKDNCGQPLLFIVVEEAKEWIQNHQEMSNADSSACDQETPGIPDSEATCTKPKEKETVKTKGTSQDDDQKFGRQTKKPPMKTASDVISRIQWDDQLKADHFIVAYLDRFIGVVEQPFSAFYWEDIAAVDHRTLAIPRHRIQYFKYKDEVVWDKTQRLDNVFGSLGSGITILDVVERFAKENVTEEGGDEKDLNEMTDCNIHDDRDASMVKTGDENSQKRHINKTRPNYFIAIHITDEDIKSRVTQIQDHMTKLNPLASSYLASTAQLHVTLCMLQLATEAQINTTLSVLKSIQEELASMLLPVTMLRFQGVDAFHDRILYIPPQADANLGKMTRRMRSALSSAGINLTGTRDEFVPHLTIMKVPREEFSRHPVVTSDLKSKFADLSVGMQAVDAIHLCSINDRPAHDKFYHSLARLDLME